MGVDMKIINSCDENVVEMQDYFLKHSFSVRTYKVEKNENFSKLIRSVSQ